jgi:hypothetical protein
MTTTADDTIPLKLEKLLPDFVKKQERRLIWAQLEFANNKGRSVRTITLDVPQFSTHIDWRLAFRRYAESLCEEYGPGHFTISWRVDGANQPYTRMEKFCDGWVSLTGRGEHIRHSIGVGCMYRRGRK